MTTPQPIDVVGAGVIGAAVAWQAARRGHQVRLYDPLLAHGAAQTGASFVAGGMLAPYSELVPGDEDLLALGHASLELWPGFAADLEEATGTDVVTGRGTLVVGADGADVAELGRLTERLAALGHGRAEHLDRAGVRERAPMLARGLRGGLWLSDESAVGNRTLLSALRRAATEAGAEAIPASWPGQTPGRTTVIAAGHAAGQVLPAPATARVRPVKGEILRLRRRSSSPAPPALTVRAHIHGRSVYLVPRPDGIVVGATMYEHGEDRDVTVAGVRDLLADAETVFPGVTDYALVDAAAGLRPMTDDNLPLIGAIDPRTVLACGHGRGGVLLTPLTVAAVLAALEGTSLPAAAPADPRRFS